MAGISFRPFYERWEAIPEKLQPIAHQLYHWAYYQAFQVSLEKIREGAATEFSNEVSREPQLLSYFEKALEATAHIHINVERSSIFNEEMLGRKEHYFRWHDAGYKSTTRAETYEKRLAVWKEIFDKSDPVSYESVLQSRMAGGTDGLHVPYWMIWNYGSEKPAGRAGYPNHAGIHFIEAGEKSIPAFRKQALRYLQTYALNLVRGNRIRRPAVLGNSAWLKVYTKTYGNA